MSKKLGIKDIAEALNISKASVSVVLNGKARQYGISPRLEKEIFEFAKKVNYLPSSLAVGLSTGKSKTIGMLVEDISDPFFASIARIVEKNAAAFGYRVLYGSTENDTLQALDLLKTFRSYQVEGFIIAPPPGIDAYINQLISEGCPIVMFDRSIDGLKCDTILVDNFKGAYMATQHLIENGYRNIAMVTILSGQDQMDERIRGYSTAMRESDLPDIVQTIAYNNYQEECTGAIKTLIQGNPQIDAFFFATNYLAIEGLVAFKDLGLVVPDNIGVVVFDDNTNFELFNPSISAVAQPIQQIGQEVIRLLLMHLEGDADILQGNLILQTELKPRSSSQPPPVI
nr:substrate-binding domain-containing protein [uncultured Mucilaginibacter sp.]